MATEAFGQGQEHDLLKHMIGQTRENFKSIGKQKDEFQKAKRTADSGFHNKASMKMLAEEGIDAYVADNKFRKLDKRFSDIDRYKEKSRKQRRPPEKVTTFPDSMRLPFPAP